MKPGHPCRLTRGVGNHLVILVLSAIAGVFVPGARQTAAQEGVNRLPLTHVADIPLPGRTTRLDYASYDPGRHLLFLAHLGDSEVIVVDVLGNRRIATTPLGGEAGNTQYDPNSRHIFVNVQTRNELVEIDPAVDRIIERIALTGADHNHGLLIDSRDRLAFVACQDNEKLLVFDMVKRQVVQSFDAGKDPDVLAFDPALSRLYVAGEAGIVSIFGINGSKVAKIGEGHLGPNAHVVAIDPATHRSYFPLKNLDGRPVLRVMAPR